MSLNIKTECTYTAHKPKDTTSSSSDSATAPTEIKSSAPIFKTPKAQD